MAYDPTTDFFGLVRQSGLTAEFARAPGLDMVVAALARAKLFNLSVGQSAPTVNQDSTVWLKPAEPSWTAEGVVYLWDASTGGYVIATPELWTALFVATATGSFQSVTGAAASILPATTLLAIERNGPTATALALPSVTTRENTPLQFVDWSELFGDHTITFAADGAETVMKRPTFQAVSTPDQLQGLTLYPSIDLNGWVVAP